MAREIIVLALVFFAIVGMASAAGDHKEAHAAGAEAPKTSAAGGDGVIGTITGGHSTDAAPVGGPVPAGSFHNLAPGPSSKSTRLEVTTVAGAFAAATVAGSFFF